MADIGSLDYSRRHIDTKNSDGINQDNYDFENFSS